jgi:hypothetical protein
VHASRPLSIARCGDSRNLFPSCRPHLFLFLSPCGCISLFTDKRVSLKASAYGKYSSAKITSRMASKSTLPFAERYKHHPHPLVRRLFDIAERKKTNIVLSADLTTTNDLLAIANSKSAL